MKLWSAKEGFEAAPIARYRCRLVETGTKNAANTNAPMVTWTGEIIEGPYAGNQFFDNAITDQDFRGSGFGKKKLRGLGVDVDTPNVEVPDQLVAQQLLGRTALVDLDQEPVMDESVPGSGTYDKPRTTVNPKTGQQIPVMKNVGRNYYPDPAAQVVHQVPQLQPAPQQFAQAPQPQQALQAPQQFAPPQQAPQQMPQQQAYAPPGWPAPGAPQGFAPPQAPQAQQFAPQAPQGWSPPPQGHPAGQLPPQQQFAVPPWGQALQAPPDGATETKKRVKAPKE